MNTHTPPYSTETYIFVIDPAQHTCELSCFNELVQRSNGYKFQYFAPALFGVNDVLTTDACPTVIVILGSGASVYDNQPWQSDVNQWLLAHMKSGTPTLGICYGHQLLAHLFGGRVAIGFDGEKKKGQRDIALTPGHRLTRAASTAISGPVIVSHREVVTDPGELEIIGSSEILDTEVIAHPTLPVLGFQAHIEATPEFLINNSIPVDPIAHSFSFGQRLLDQFIQNACADRASRHTGE